MIEVDGDVVFKLSELVSIQCVAACKPPRPMYDGPMPPPGTKATLVMTFTNGHVMKVVRDSDAAMAATFAEITAIIRGATKTEPDGRPA